MAHPDRRLPGNASGDFYVDDSCIDCDTCRWMAPGVFRRDRGRSAVGVQPADGAERMLALQAAVACPTASIGTLAPAPEMSAARASFPLEISGGVCHCGYHSRKSFGAAAYLIRRAGGNVLVDSPRFSETLARRIEELGGADLLFLTHGDDVADHQAWKDRLGCARMLHAGDADRGTRGLERLIDGRAPLDLAPDLRVVPVPGHTAGSCVLLYREEFLFTGDHLAFSPRLGHLYAFRDACWHSWREQIRSMEALRGYSFEWVLPGHGRRHHASREAMRAQLEACLRWMADSASPEGD